MSHLKDAGSVCELHFRFLLDCSYLTLTCNREKKTAKKLKVLDVVVRNNDKQLTLRSTPTHKRKNKSNEAITYLYVCALAQNYFKG